MGLVTTPAATGVAGATGATTTAYDTTISPAPVSLPSEGYEATSTSEMGQQIQLQAGSSRSLSNVVVDMESWACESGGDDTCTTTPGATFSQPLTLNLYNVGPGNSVGTRIGTFTQTFAIPYRPSSGTCTTDATAYLGADNVCHHGILAPVTFTFPTPLTVPGTLIYGVAFNTQNYGASPTGTDGPYDSLNLALNDLGTGPSVGADPAGSDSLYQNSANAGFYCGGAAGSFRIDDGLHDGCWTPYEPAVQFNMENACTTTCYVSPTGDDSNSGAADSPFATIQHAVDSVSPGGTVHVAAGTYSGAVHITQAVTLLGANAGLAATGSRGAESVISVSPAPATNIEAVQISASNVTVDGFAVQQTGTTTCTSCADFGVQVDPTASGATVADNVINGMAVSGTSPKTGNPIGVDVAGNNSNLPNGVTVARNLIENISSSGSQHVSALGIEVGDSTVTASGTGLLIAGNHITGVSSQWGAYGIIFNRPTTGSQVLGNSIDTINGVGWAHGIGLEGNETSPVIADNAVSGVVGSATDSVDIFTDATNLGVASATVTHNSLGGVTAGGIGSASAGAMNAAGNYWGCPTGANTTGCSVTGGSGAVSTTPWIVSYTPDPAHAGQPGFWPTAIVSSSAPVFSSAASTSIYQGVVGQTFTVAASSPGSPAPTLSESGTLPTGITFNPATGVLSGTTNAVGSYAITFTAVNNVGTTVQAFTLSVLAAAPAFTSAAHATFVVGHLGTADITLTGAPTPTVTEAGKLPVGVALVSVGPGHYQLTGTPAANTGKVYSTIKLFASGTSGRVKQVFTLTVDQAPAITSVSGKSGKVGTAFSLTLKGSGFPKPTFSSGSLPAGVTITNTGNGKATLGGHYLVGTQTFTITASNGTSPDATQSFTLQGK